MQETIVSFKTAKLAKEVCFNDLDSKQYSEDGLEPIKGFVYNGISAPTQALLQKWIREIHGLHINIDLGIGWGYQLIHAGWTKKPFSEKFVDEKNFNTYEEALEEALYQALLLIKKS